MSAPLQKDLLLSVSLLVLIVVGISGYAGWRLLNQPAPNAYMAMAKGQYLVASEYYGDEADAGNPDAQNSLANLYYLGLGVEQNFEKAAELYLASARNGFAPAQVNLGHLFSQGFGVRQDPMKAFAWYQQSHIHGNVISEYYLRQIAVEYTLTPLQISTAREKWSHLQTLAAEGL